MNLMPTPHQFSLPALSSVFRLAAPSLRFLPSLIVVALFLADFWFPFELAVAMYYVAALLFVVALPQRADKYSVALVYTILALVDYLVAPEIVGAPGWLRVFNHGL
jgi:hypothetical protein